MTKLPAAFAEKMRALLKDEYGEFLKSFEEERVQGLRVNLLKAEPEDFVKKCLFPLTPVMWAEEGFYYSENEKPGKHPYHEAGLYYIQEPSAMAAAALLNPQPGENILDLCAAPGGKTTHIAGRMRGEGFLLSNEIHPQRARILSSNVERMGIGSAVVTNETPGVLAVRFPQFFDRIAVDAPCSGEGMFRKDPAAAGEWDASRPALCAARQKEILEAAASMLKPGGSLVYSTCTFSPEENEGVIEAFLRCHPEFTLSRPEAFSMLGEGRPEWTEGGRADLAKAIRIWPHKVRGEGHFLALLQKEGARPTVKSSISPLYVRDRAALKEFSRFFRETLAGDRDWEAETQYILFGEQLYLLPEAMPDMRGLKVVRPGLHLGTLKKNRFEPSHALALYLKRDGAVCTHLIDSGADEAARYLKGETIPADGEKGWVLMCVDGYPLGWAKASGGILKNHYPKGLRWF